MSSLTTEHKTLKFDLNLKIALPRLAEMAVALPRAVFCVFPWGIPLWLAQGPLKELCREKYFSVLTYVYLKV